MRSFKVLTIDGGGIKGLYSATILRHFESDIRQEYGDDARIVDYVDLICGTSTGGLIALALALRVPAETICRFYEGHGPKIFQGADSYFASLRQALFRSKFSDKPLRAALNEMFQEHKLADSYCLLCIPTFDFTGSTYEIFKFDHKEGNLRRHNRLSMVDVALATSAAPTYFPIAQIDLENDTQYIDGGIWANNPSLIGFTEAMTYFVGAGKLYERLDLLSIASLEASAGKPPLLNRYRGFLQWAPELFELSLIGQNEFADVFLGLVQKNNIFPLTYTRIPSATISRQQSQYTRLDSANKRSFALMKKLATDMYYTYLKNPNVKSFFSTRKTYLTRD